MLRPLDLIPIMKVHSRSKTLVLRENAEWLRGVFWLSALGMGTLLVSFFSAAERDMGKIIGSALGVLLFGFSGFVLQTRRIVIDPLRRETIIESKRFRGTTTTRLRFDDIVKILLVTTFENVEDARGANVLRERWAIAFLLADRSVPVTKNSYPTKAAAVRDAEKIRELVAVELIDTVADSIAHLAQNGQQAAALTLACRALHMTTAEAKALVEQQQAAHK